MDVRLELERGEAQELEQALEAQLYELRVELARSDLRDYKAELRARLERLETVAARLKAAETALQ
jgi:hypothetical protein